MLPSLEPVARPSQKRPPIKKYVLVLLKRLQDNIPEHIAVGYRKDHAGDKQAPYFVVPGLGGKVIAWCDCLSEDMKWPLELCPSKSEE